MNVIVNTPYVFNKRKWYFLSIFYARKKWGELTAEIMHFYNERQNQFETYLVSFSKEKGENIQVTFVTPENDNNDYSAEIQSFFQQFVEQRPSISNVLFPYGKAIWCNYTNNSLEWNIFRLPAFSDQYVNFHQKTMAVVLNLLEDDFSEDIFLSTGLYLITKELCCIDSCNQKNIVSQLHHEISLHSKDQKINQLISKFDRSAVSNTIESYIYEDENGYSTELIHWLIEVKNLLKIYDFMKLYYITCKILNINTLNQKVLLELIFIGYNHILIGKELT